MSRGERVRWTAAGVPKMIASVHVDKRELLGQLTAALTSVVLTGDVRVKADEAAP
jgi:hypothetical protein